MSSLQSAFNPFELMMNPQAVLAAVERSERLGSLASRICRPLDTPLPGQADGDAAGGDAAVDDAVDDAAGADPAG